MWAYNNTKNKLANLKRIPMTDSDIWEFTTRMRKNTAIFGICSSFYILFEKDYTIKLIVNYFHYSKI